MAYGNLTWLDKAIWTVAKATTFGGDPIPNIWIAKVAVVTSFTFYIAGIYTFFRKVYAPSLPVLVDTEWVLLTLLICYVPVHLATHSAEEILRVNLSGRARWTYVMVASFLVPPLGWLIPGLFGLSPDLF